MPGTEKIEEIDWRETVQKMIDLAATDPGKFAEEAKTVAKRFGVTVEQVYAKLQEDEKLPGRTFRNSIIQSVAKRLKRELDL